MNGVDQFFKFTIMVEQYSHKRQLFRRRGCLAAL